ncbi:MAG TPA: DUF3090 family protein [Acidimicrobiia bacterium]|jgi:uncharacterized repeat protein (TIGR03847 family)
MDNVIELDTVDALGAGAIGDPGERVFYIQADKADARLTVVVEKEQVALLAAEAVAFLDRIGEEYPEEPGESSTLHPSAAQVTEPAVPLFRARMIGLGFEPDRRLVLLELRERAEDEDEDEPAEETALDDEGYVARIFATRAQVRAMAARGAEAVSGGRPLCQLCNFPMDPAGHICPRWN